MAFLLTLVIAGGCHDESHRLGGGGAAGASGGPDTPSDGGRPEGGSGPDAAGAPANNGGVSGAGGSSAGWTSAAGRTPESGGGALGSSGSPEEAGASGAGVGDGASGAAGEPRCETPTNPAGTPITFNDNGGWCWYQDERAIVDTEANTLIIGSVAIGGGRGGDIEVTAYDLAGGSEPERSTLGTNLSPDDHNTPALVKASTGRYLAVYTGHNEDCNSYYHVYENGSWGPQTAFDWGSVGCPTSDQRTVSYSNLWPMPGQIFNFVRSFETSPNLLTTADGSSFAYAGRLTSTAKVGYVAGYYKYWGNGIDRIDFVGTEAHPRDKDNSLYHGYVETRGELVKSYDSMGNEQEVIDEASKDNAPDITAFTKIFATGTTLHGVRLERLWNHDIMRYDDGTIVVLGQGRVTGTGSVDPDKRFIYLRFDGSTWNATYLVKAGTKLYADEQDYTGLGAIHPNDPQTIYVSTMYDPRDDTTPSSKREIWRGTTCDEGKTFVWTPITENSTQDNIRPIVPYWPGGKTALLWMRGDYFSAQTYQTSVVGLIMDGS